jgi:hypothetical protein
LNYHKEILNGKENENIEWKTNNPIWAKKYTIPITAYVTIVTHRRQKVLHEQE